MMGHQVSKQYCILIMSSTISNFALKLPFSTQKSCIGRYAKTEALKQKLLGSLNSPWDLL